MKYLFLILLLLISITTVSANELQVLTNNVTVSIVNNGNNSMNISFKTQGGTSIEYLNQPVTSTINEVKQVYFIGDLECSNTSTTFLMWKSCVDFFNDSCDGFLCPTAYQTTKEKLNNTQIELNKYKNNETDVSMVLGNLTKCQTELVNKNCDNMLTTTGACNLMGGTWNTLTNKCDAGKTSYFTAGVIGVLGLICGYVINEYRRYGKRPNKESELKIDTMKNLPKIETDR
jgi:hypothetical protein